MTTEPYFLNKSCMLTTVLYLQDNEILVSENLWGDNVKGSSDVIIIIITDGGRGEALNAHFDPDG